MRVAGGRWTAPSLLRFAGACFDVCERQSVGWRAARRDEGDSDLSPHENRPLDGRYWEEHWQSLGEDALGEAGEAANPYIVSETSGLRRGTALDAGCGAGAEAVWLAEQGWDVTGADISPTALAKARRRAEAAGLGSAVRWVEADLMAWAPGERWDLVVTSYAHPPGSQIDFYRRISRWVAPGGTLLVVGHLHGSGVPSGEEAPEGTTVALEHVAGLFDGDWSIETARQSVRMATARDGGDVEMRDVVVRARRLR